MNQPMEGMRLRQIEVDPNDLAWRGRAACKGLDPGLFHPDENGGSYFLQVESAQTVCSGCAVRVECLEYAIKYGETKGVWGGMSERERKRETKRRQRVARKARGSRG